jgi:hypothetical protein
MRNELELTAVRLSQRSAQVSVSDCLEPGESKMPTLLSGSGRLAVSGRIPDRRRETAEAAGYRYDLESGQQELLSAGDFGDVARQTGHGQDQRWRRSVNASYLADLDGVLDHCRNCGYRMGQLESLALYAVRLNELHASAHARLRSSSGGTRSGTLSFVARAAHCKNGCKRDDPNDAASHPVTAWFDDFALIRGSG